MRNGNPFTATLIRLRLAPPSERYQRFANRGDALTFAADLRDTCPSVGTAVYFGAPLGRAKGERRRGTQTPGFVVALADDREAALAAGAGRAVQTFKVEGD